jgi:hypothetical protein
MRPATPNENKYIFAPPCSLLYINIKNHKNNLPSLNTFSAHAKSSPTKQKKPTTTNTNVIFKATRPQLHINKQIQNRSTSKKNLFAHVGLIQKQRSTLAKKLLSMNQTITPRD